MYFFSASVNYRQQSNMPKRRGKYIQKQAHRDVSAANFSNGQINFNICIPQGMYWSPSKSFFDMRVSTMQNDNTSRLADETNIAPAMFQGDTCFRQMCLKVNGQPISRIDDYVAQVSALKHRIKRTDSWLNTVGKYDIISEFSWAERKNLVTSDGGGRAKGKYSLAWQPALGVWNKEYLPAGKYQLELLPKPASVLSIHGVDSNGNVVAANNYSFRVERMHMYLWTGVDDSPPQGEYGFSFSECRCQSQNITTNSLTQKTFTVDPRTRALSLAFQASDAGQASTRSITLFKAEGDDELNLERHYISFRGQKLPDTIPELEYASAGADADLDYFTQMYREQMEYSGAHKKPDHEDLITWEGRGIYFHYDQWPSSGSDKVHVSHQFSAAFTSATQLLLFDHWDEYVKLHYQQGKISKVSMSSYD